MISPRPQLPSSGTKRTGRSIRCCRNSSRMILVDRYQSIVDTFVQLFVLLPFCCDCLIAIRFDRDMHDEEKGE